MSIKKQVITNSEIYTIYSSERQERMKVYFKLQKEFDECMVECPKFDLESQRECEENCGKIYDKYALMLADKYTESPERLEMEVEGSEIFTKRKRPEKHTFYQRLFGV